MKQTTIASIFVLLFVPASLAAAGMLQADDSVAGFGTDITLAGYAKQETYTVVLTPPLGPAAEAIVRTNVEGGAMLHIPGQETEMAGTYAVTVEQSGIPTEGETVFNVLADRMSAQHSVIQAASDTVLANGQQELPVFVIVRDQYGNPLSGRPLALLSSRDSDEIVARTNVTDRNGKQEFTLRTHENGTIALRAIDMVSATVLSGDTVAAVDAHAMGGPPYDDFQPSAMNGMSRGVPRPSDNGFFAPPTASLLGSPLYAQTVRYGLVDHFEIKAPTQLNLNEDVTISIKAVDQNGITVEDYMGTVLLSSTDPTAYLPLDGTVQFLPQNLGEKVLTLGLRFRQPGQKTTTPGITQHILRAVDSSDSQVMGQITMNVAGELKPAAGTRIKVIAPEKNTILSSAEVEVKGLAEPFINLIVEGGIEDVFGGTEIDGTFTISVKLDPTKAEHTLRVTDELGQMDSGEFTVLLDIAAPEIASVNFTPEKPMEEGDVLLVVVSEPALKSITATIGKEEYVLESSAGKKDTYQTLFKAPPGGTYEVSIAVTDNVGNIGKKTAELIVGFQGLPQVKNLTAKAETNGVTLQWDPITNEVIGAYRIYVGETPKEFGFTLDTNVASTAAQVAGLRPGVDYYFAVTALQGDRESSEKSNVVKTTVLGLRLDIKAQDSSLLLDWSSLRTDASLTSFILEYGVEPDAFLEKRILNGNLRTYVLRDLINNVKYYLQLTPVDVTGKRMADFAVKTEGRPTTLIAGFKPTPADPAPINATLHASAPPRGAEHNENAENTASVGLPSAVWFITALGASGGLLFYWHRRTTLQTTAFLSAMEARYRQ